MDGIYRVDYKVKGNPKVSIIIPNKDGKDIGYYNGSYSEIEVSKQNEWTTETIKERGLSMLQFLKIHLFKRRFWIGNFRRRKHIF